MRNSPGLPRGRGAASRSWSATQSARLCSNHRPPVRLLSGTASQGVRPSNTIAFTTSPDAAGGGGLCRQRSMNRPCAVAGSSTYANARAMECIAWSARLHTSIPVVIETFTFFDRNANRDVALTWRESIYKRGTVKILPCELRDLHQSWEYFRRTDLYKLSAVDATSFAIMKRARIQRVPDASAHQAARFGDHPVLSPGLRAAFPTDSLKLGGAVRPRATLGHEFRHTDGTQVEPR